METETIPMLIFSIITVVFSAIGGFIGALLNGKYNKELERSRFRHEISSISWSKSVEYHTELSHLVSDAYRVKRNSGTFGQSTSFPELDKAKNFYHDYKFFFSSELCSAYKMVEKSLSIANPNTNILESNINAFRQCIRDDLLLSESAESAQRAVGRTSNA